MDIDKILRVVGAIVMGIILAYVVYKAFTFIIWIVCMLLLAMMYHPLACIGVLVMLGAMLYFFFKWQDRRD